jgi:hypothetical protein
MNQIINLVDEEKPSGVAPMQIDGTKPVEQSTSLPLDPGPSTAAPPLALNGATAATGEASVPAPANGVFASDALRYSQREKRPSRQRMLMDQIGEQPQHLRMNRRGVRISLQEMQAHLKTM